MVIPVSYTHLDVYKRQVLDRLSYFFHRQEFVGKPALTVVTTGGGGQKPTGKYLKMTACGWGCHLIGEISIVSSQFFESGNKQSSPWGYQPKYHDSKLRDITKKAKAFEQAMFKKELPVPSFYDIFMFQCLRSKTFLSKADYEFWKQKGWLDSRYFYDVPLSPAKKIFAYAIRQYIDSATRRMMGPNR